MTSGSSGPTSVAQAADSVLHFDYPRCARLAGISKWQWLVYAALACGTAATDAGMLTLLVPLASATAGGAGIGRFWRLPAVSRLLPHPPDAVSAFLWLAGLLFALALVKNAFKAGQHSALWRMRTGAAQHVSNRLFARYLTFGKAWFDQNNIGIAAAIMEHPNDLAQVFGSLLRMTSNALLLAGYLAVMLLISWRLTLIAALLFPTVSLATRLILDRTGAAARKAREVAAKIARHVHEVLAAMPLYQAAGQEKQASTEFAEATSRLRESSMRMGRLQGLSARIQELAALAALVAMLALALILQTEHAWTIQAGLILVFFFIARLSLPVLATFPESILDIAERLPRCRALLAVFDDEDKFRVSSGATEFRNISQSVRFESLTFAYPDGPPVLHNATFELRKGQMTALVGPSGSGKTTVTNLLMRFYDLPPGAVRIDGIDIREYSTASLRQGFAIVGQDVILLSGTLRSNLVFGLDRDVGASELDGVIDEARLKDVVSMLPGGLDGGVGEHGARLSGGQRQRVAIARAILRRSSLLMLDEATSGLDAITEELVREAIANAARHSTTLVIAHRFATIQRADHVIVLNAGRVVQQGSLTELLAVDGLFQQMSERQQF